MADGDQLIPTLAMVRDPRLRRLFALVGRALDDRDLGDVEDDLLQSMLELAPEYIAPEDGQPGEEYRAEWEQMVREASDG